VALALVLAAGLTSAQSGKGRALERYNEGLLLEMEEDWPAAVERHLEALRINPAYADPMISLARCYEAMGEYERALDWARSAEPLRKGSSELAAMKGRILTSMGRLAEAEQAFQTVLAAEPNNLEARFGLALLDMAGGRPLGAIKRFQEALRLSPLNARALLSLALVYEATGSPAASKAAMEQALRAHSSDPRVRFYAAYLAAVSGSLEEAAAHCRTALSVKSDYPEAKRLLASILFASGRPAEAAASMEQAISNGQRLAGDFYILGTARAASGDPAGAVSALSAALKADPDDEIARIALERVLLDSFKPEDPIRAPWAAYHFQKAAEAMASDYRTEAAFEFRRGLRLDPYSTEGRVAFAELLRKRGLPASYLAELQAAESLGSVPLRVQDAIEAYTSLLSDSVSRRWNIDQFQIDKRSAVLAVFRLPGSFSLGHADAQSRIAGYLKETLSHSPRLRVAELPEEINSFSQAFKLARESGVDYFFLLEADEGQRDVSLEIQGYSGRTGAKTETFKAYRSGNERLKHAVMRLTSAIEAALPLRGTILSRSRDTILAGLGAADGLKQGAELLILKKGSLAWAEGSFGLSYAQSDILGSIALERLDDEVAEGNFKKAGFFDMINPGDELILKPEPAASVKAQATASPSAPSASIPRGSLYELLRSLR